MVRPRRRRGRSGPPRELYFFDGPDRSHSPRAQSVRPPQLPAAFAEPCVSGYGARCWLPRVVARPTSLPYFGAVTPAEARALLDADPAARLIDVRPAPNGITSVACPERADRMEHLSRRNAESGFLEELRRAVGQTDAPVLFLCRSGHRSDSAARTATAAGYSARSTCWKGSRVTGPLGIGNLGGWRKAGLPWFRDRTDRAGSRPATSRSHR